MPRSANTGFTLVELLCVMAILAILSSAGLSRFTAYQQSRQNKHVMREAITHLSQTLQDARQMAIATGVMTYVCGGKACSGRWSTGFELHQSPRGQRNKHTHPTRRVVFDPPIALHWKGFPAHRSRIEFLANGLSSYQNGTFQFCLRGWHSSIVLNQSGRFYVADLIKSEVPCD